MTEFGELSFKPGVLRRFDLPDRLYPVPVDWFAEALTAGADLRFELLLAGLQRHSAERPNQWQADEAAMARLAALIAPEDNRETITVTAESWWLELGIVDLDKEIVTIQRQDHVIAAFSSREDGRLRAAVYRPIDAKSAGYLTGLSSIGGSMGRDNWGYALDSSAGMGNVYAAGSSYLSYWERGLGVFLDGRTSEVYRPQATMVPRRPAVVATELGVFWQYGRP